MTPREKAKELFDKYRDDESAYPIDCVRICVDDIMNSDENCTMYMHDVGVSMFMKYWKEVKIELENYEKYYR